MRKLLAVSLILCAGANAAPCEKYGKPGVVLTGTVKIKTFFGPPNYGESPATDSKEQQAILRLTKPLCTLESEDESAEQDQTEVTLVPMGKFGFSQFAGKSVQVSGSLFQAFTAHHNTSLLLEVRQQPKLLDPQPGRRK